MRILRGLVLAIAGSTFLTGLIQLILPGVVLDLVGGGRSAEADHFFRIIGMFMLLFGGMLWQASISGPKNRPVLFWSSLQKLGAAIAVSFGTLQGLFGPLGWAVAIVDFASALLIATYLVRQPD